MKIIIHLFLLLCSITAYSQVDENYILFNYSSDTVVTLHGPASSFEINTNFNGANKIEIFHIRANKLISSTVSTLTNFKCNYTTQPLTNDVFFVQIISTESDSVLLYKRFHLINMFTDNITKSTFDSINRCNDAIQTPYMFTFNIFINDKKINNYEVTLFRTFKTHQTAEYSSTTIYNDSIAVKRVGNTFYLSEKNDSMALVINIGKSGTFFYEITDPNFKYGASLYFAVSTNDKKLYKSYKAAVMNKTYSELREIPYLAIAKNYSKKYSYSKKHSVMYVNCNEKCNLTAINYDFRSQWYKLKKLK